MMPYVNDAPLAAMGMPVPDSACVARMMASGKLEAISRAPYDS